MKRISCIRVVLRTVLIVNVRCVRKKQEKGGEMVNKEYEFLDRCARLEVTEFIGVARILKVNFIGEDGKREYFDSGF